MYRSKIKNRKKKTEILKAIQDAKVPRASAWLGVLPLTEFSFALNKGEFTDATSLICGKHLKGLSAMCPCGQKSKVAHALNCKKGRWFCDHAPDEFEGFRS